MRLSHPVQAKVAIYCERKKKERRNRGNASCQTEAICSPDGEIICVSGVIVAHDNHGRRRRVWLRFDATARTGRCGKVRLVTTLRESSRKAVIPQRNGRLLFSFRFVPVFRCCLHTRATYYEMSLALNGGGVTDINLLLNAAAAHLTPPNSPRNVCAICLTINTLRVKFHLTQLKSRESRRTVIA